MVLALKYRPKKFSEVIGQEATIQTLVSSLDKKQIANAYLFSGLRGSGKTSTARIFAKALQCSKGESSHPCEECENCKMANENSHIDIIEMDAASHRKIEDIKELIEHTRYKPTLGKYKIFIIDEVHMLTREAFNALLKTLEEPPEFVKFILATTDPLKLPATILSRTQHYRFTKINPSLIKNHLEYILAKEGVEYDNKAIELLSKSGNGSLRDTLTLLDQAIAYSKGKVELDSVVEMLGVVNPEIIEDMFGLIFEQNKEKVKDLASKISDYDIEAVLDEIVEFLKEALFENRFSVVTIERFFKVVVQTKELIKINVDNEFVLSLMMFKMIEATKPHKIDELIQNFEQEIKHNGIKNVKTEKSKTNNKTQHCPEKLFESLKQAIFDRDEEIYKCFEKVKFVSFEDGTLVWESCVDDECKKLLKKYWGSVIKFLIDENFGIGTKVVPQKCKDTKENEPTNSKVNTKKIAQKQEEPIEKKIINKAREIFADEIMEVNIYK